ncbi:MAG: hypothetical protein LBT48_05390 [Prevotellaceae bacterium]|jgi:hypothetical protein|nr:hypothetical protein [Prevotellaceae bacterium]
MKTTLQLFILTLCSAALFAACHRDLHCPAFPDHIADYYPYQLGDTLKFTNQKNDTVMDFVIINWYKTEVHTIDGNSDGACGCSYGFYTSLHDDINIEVIISANVKYTAYPHMNLDMGKSHFSVRNADKKLDSLPFGNPIVFEDTTRRIVVVYGQGITEIQDKTTDYLWTKK